jgi:hypothetical protein
MPTLFSFVAARCNGSLNGHRMIAIAVSVCLSSPFVIILQNDPHYSALRMRNISGGVSILVRRYVLLQTSTNIMSCHTVGSSHPLGQWTLNSD